MLLIRHLLNVNCHWEWIRKKLFREKPRVIQGKIAEQVREPFSFSSQPPITEGVLKKYLDRLIITNQNCYRYNNHLTIEVSGTV